MKNKIKLSGIIVMVAIIGFSFGACGDGSGTGGGKQGTAPAITSTSLPDGKEGVAYSETLAATGDKPITWSLESGSLPAGLSLAGTSVISGMPTTANTYTFTVKATNATGSDTKQLSITITSGGAPAITTTTLPGGTVGVAYSQTLAARGDTPITWHLESGTLPAGLSLAEETGTISGTPTAEGEGTSNFTVKAANSAGNGTRLLSITIVAASPTITTATLPGGTVGTAYSQTLAATGVTPITWSLESGSLPAGLSLAETGVISGEPTAAGTSNFTVKAVNSAGNGTKQLSITITGVAPPAFIEMVQIQGGTFQMGSPEEEPGRDPDETQHEVTLTSFYMGKYPVTQEQYEAVTGKTIVEQQALATYPSTTDYGRGDNFPMYYVSWYDALVFCNKLSMQEGLSPAYRINGSTNPAAWGSVPTNSNATWNAVQIVSSSNGYRLPTEAQWEYACRAGTYTPFNTGNNITTDQANYSGDNPYNGNPGGIYLGRTTEVGSFAPNDWNLYDMHGNVWEWCWDWYDTYASDAQTDPTGAVSGTLRMARGGAWDTIGSSLRSAYRFSPNSGPGYVGSIMGFRLVRPIASSGGNQTLIEMIQIQGGNFTMGSPESETGSTSIERPQHLVMLSGFSMGKYPVTQAQYQAVMGTNPSDFTTAVSPETSTANRPVENVSWYDAIVFCNKLSMRESLSPAYSISGSTDPAVWGTVPTTSNTTWNAVIIVAGSNGYRLPTEAQWEYACRAGTTTAYNTGDTISDNTGWYSGNSGERTHTVGEKSVNAYGLYDMHGNVWEWCWDWYAAYVSETQTDPIGPETGPMRVKRGGAWYYSAPILRSASRTINNPQYVDNYNGFRLVRPAQ